MDRQAVIDDIIERMAENSSVYPRKIYLSAYKMFRQNVPLHDMRLAFKAIWTHNVELLTSLDGYCAATRMCERKAEAAKHVVYLLDILIITEEANG